MLTSDDVAFVRHHNRLASPKHRIQENSLPEPFIGNPNSAKLVLLNLNPGHDGSVETDHGRPEIKDAIFDNLYQRHAEYPFYAFNPAFGKTTEFEQTGVAKYWRERTIRLQEATGLADAAFAKKMFVIEWFPYPSENWFCTAEKYEKTRNSLCPSQDYNFQLALSFVDDPRAIVLGMRSKRYWVEHGTGFIRQDCQTDDGVARLLPEHLLRRCTSLSRGSLRLLLHVRALEMQF